MLDFIARIVFPATFILFTVAFWFAVTRWINAAVDWTKFLARITIAAFEKILFVVINYYINRLISDQLNSRFYGRGIFVKLETSSPIVSETDDFPKKFYISNNLYFGLVCEHYSGFQRLETALLTYFLIAAVGCVVLDFTFSVLSSREEKMI